MSLPTSLRAGHSGLRDPSPAAPLVFVHSTDDIERLVLEGQRHTGQASRTFVISGADRLSYRLSLQRPGFRVQRLDDDGRVSHTQDLMTFELLEHSLMEALEAGQLFAVPLDQASMH